MERNVRLVQLFGLQIKYVKLKLTHGRTVYTRCIRAIVITFPIVRSLVSLVYRVKQRVDPH